MLVRTLAFVVLVLLALAPETAARPLSPAERAAGWRPLFDGATFGGWRGYRRTEPPAKGWTIENGELRCLAGGGGGDLVTVEEFGDFELALEFRVAEKANSGIMYRVTERHDAPWMTGPEYQVIDDAGHDLATDDPHSAGAIYALQAPPADRPRVAAGEWHSARIRVRHGVVKHWLDGVKVAEIDMNAPDWAERIAASKFHAYDGFGVQPRGRIALQDHGDEVRYRNIAVRDLEAPMPGEVQLFNGADLAGWTHHLQDGGPIGGTWSVERGDLVCAGRPAGYIRTTETYADYVLRLEWRFEPDAPGNSGVLLRVNGEDRVWPRSIEAQLHSGNAGDFWNIGEMRMAVDPARTNGRNTRKTHFAERPLGQWNAYEIVVDGGTVILRVNGEELNRATGCEPMAGWIALQSEGVPIRFRRVRLAPIPAAAGGS